MFTPTAGRARVWAVYSATQMAEAPQFRPGDLVVHPLRPEWGRGVVGKAQQIVHQGEIGQRLVVAFANHGTVTMNTAVVPLTPKDAPQQMSISTSPEASSHGWLRTLADSNGQTEHELHALPESMTDPFMGVGGRLANTLDSYRFNTEARSILDWAVAQTGLDDPLTKYTRHELEEAFPRFARQRERHLRDLVKQIKTKGKIELLNEALARRQNTAATQALQNAIRG